MDDRHDDNALLGMIAEQLVTESACELRADTGETIELWTITALGAVVLASGPRLMVRAGMRLEWRTHVAENPIVATIVVEEATYRSERRAALRLRVTETKPDPTQRRHARRALATRVTLTAVSCDRIVDHDWISATVVDISDSGIGLRTTDPRPRPGDRFRLDLRMLGARLQTDVRITRTNQSGDGVSYLGCLLLAASPELAQLLARIDEAHHKAA